MGVLEIKYENLLFKIENADFEQFLKANDQRLFEISYECNIASKQKRRIWEFGIETEPF